MKLLTNLSEITYIKNYVFLVLEFIVQEKGNPKFLW